MGKKGATAVILISFLMLISPLLYLVTDMSLLFLTAPSSLYGLLSMVAGYISMKDDKWLPVSGAIAVFGVVLTVAAILLAWLGKSGNEIAELLSVICLFILVLMDFSLFTLVTKMEVFNYFDEN